MKILLKYNQIKLSYFYHIYKYFLIVLFFLILSNSYKVFSQDINCSFQLSTQMLEGTDKKIYETMEKAINEFLKNRKWTNYNFKPEERIECSILINITERVSTNEFKATIQVQSSRPVYKTSYKSTLFNHIDKDFQFKYEEFQPLDFDQNSHLLNLTSVLAYYMYIIIGLDFDSFSNLGGSPYFNIAQTIVNNAQNSSDKGWKSFESRKNRYWLVENLLNQSYQPLREFIYRYQRKGMDVMYDNMQKGRTEISEALELVKKVHREKPGLYSTTLIMYAKSPELVNIYKEAPDSEKESVVKLLKEVDPANAAKYSEIMNK